VRVRVEREEWTSAALADNPWGDPARRPVYVVSPADVPRSEPLPAIWVLAGFFGTGASFLAFEPFGETLVERAERLMAEGRLKPVRLVLPDTFSALGGTQYIDSPAVGRYATYLWDELLPYVESTWATTCRAVAGRSSGGFGALTAAMDRPGLFVAVASHAGDMGFEWCYLPDMPELIARIRAAGGRGAFWERFRAAEPKPPQWFGAVSLLAMAATYSPNLQRADFPADLPVDEETLELVESVWAQWLKWDPVRRVERDEGARRALAALRVLYLDAGSDDEYRLQYGARRLSRQLHRYGIAHRLEIFPGGHRRTGHRWDHSLPLLADALWT
jgi:enterochelin esterase-like enzyme